MNQERLKDFHQSIVDIYENNNKKDNNVTLHLCLYVVAFILMNTFAIYLWNIDHKALVEPLGFFTFMMRIIVPAGILGTFFPITIHLISSFKEKKLFYKKQTALKKISGPNMEKYFNDLYLLFTMSDSKSDLAKLEEVVNTLSIEEPLESTLLYSFNKSLEENLENLKKLERGKVNYFKEYKKKLESKVIENTEEENIKFFEKA